LFNYGPILAIDVGAGSLKAKFIPTMGLKIQRRYLS